MLKSKYFTCKELVQSELIKIHGSEYCIERIGWFIIGGLDCLREDYEREVKKRGLYKRPKDAHIIINGRFGWFRKLFKYSGVRAKDCKVGAKYSRHKEWRAFDLKCYHFDVLVDLVLNNFEKYGIYRIENPARTKTWLHAEFGKNIDKLLIFNP